MVRNERAVSAAIKLVEKALEAARNSNQAGEDAIVGMAAWGKMKHALEMIRDADDNLQRDDRSPLMSPLVRADVDKALAYADGEKVD